MLVSVFSHQDDGFVALFQLGEDLKLENIRAVSSNHETFWRELIEDTVKWFEPEKGLEAFVSSLDYQSGRYMILKALPDSDSDFDTVYKETLVKYGATTGRRELRSRPIT